MNKMIIKVYLYEICIYSFKSQANFIWYSLPVSTPSLNEVSNLLISDERSSLVAFSAFS